MLAAQGGMDRHAAHTLFDPALDQDAERLDAGDRAARPAGSAGDRAAVEWWASWREDGELLTLAGTTVLRFGPDGLVAEHVDYWVDGTGRLEPYPGWGG